MLQPERQKSDLAALGKTQPLAPVSERCNCFVFPFVFPQINVRLATSPRLYNGSCRTLISEARAGSTRASLDIVSRRTRRKSPRAGTATAARKKSGRPTRKLHDPPPPPLPLPPPRDKCASGTVGIVGVLRTLKLRVCSSTRGVRDPPVTQSAPQSKGKQSRSLPGDPGKGRPRDKEPDSNTKKKEKRRTCESSASIIH